MHDGTGALLYLAPPSATRNWSELPLDALLFIFTKLDLLEILMGAGLVCHSWLDAAKVPSLWRCVDMASHELVERKFRCGGSGVLRAMTKMAVDRSGGQLQEFSGRRFVTAELLNYIGDRAPSLKTLRLLYGCINHEGFAEAIKKFPLLEELELTICTGLGNQAVHEIVGNACPNLKSFRQMNHGYTSSVLDDSDPEDSYSNRGEDVGGIAALSELHTLQLFGCGLSNRELTAILDRCPHLDSLDIRRCLCLEMDTDMKARLACIKTLMLPSDPTYDYEDRLIDGYFLGCHDHLASYFDDHKDYYDFDY
ncbi:unnamed protein product [Urochloa humidicola]